MKVKTSISLIVAIALGLITTKVGWDLLANYRVSRDDNGKMAKVVLAKRDLDPGYQIEASDLQMSSVPKETAPESAFKEAKDVVGRTLSTPVVSGQTMFEGLLAPVGASGCLQALVPDGMRAVTVEVSESSGVAGLIRPKAHVDVISTLKRGDSNIARTIVENAEVSAVGPRLTPAPSAVDQTPARTVTLLVTPKNAEAIELAGTNSKPRLVLRGSTDHAPSGTTGISIEELVGADPRATPAAAPQAPVTDGATTQPASEMDRILAAINAIKPATQPAAVQETQASLNRRAVQYIRQGKEKVEFYDYETPTPVVSKKTGSVGSAANDLRETAPSIPAIPSDSLRKGM